MSTPRTGPRRADDPTPVRRLADRDAGTASKASTDTSSALQAVLAPLLAVIEPLIERVMARTLAEHLDSDRKRRLLTDREIAVEVLGCSTDTLRDRLLPAGLPHVLVGDARRYDADEVVAWLRTHRGTPR